MTSRAAITTDQGLTPFNGGGSVLPMTTTAVRVAYSTTTPAPLPRMARIARVLNAPRTRLSYAGDLPWQINTETEVWCFICSRATDHTGEHEPEQIAAWLARRADALTARRQARRERKAADRRAA